MTVLLSAINAQTGHHLVSTTIPISSRVHRKHVINRGKRQVSFSAVRRLSLTSFFALSMKMRRHSGFPIAISAPKKCALQDLDMYYAEADMPARVRTMNLNEDLGQVSRLAP